MKLKIIFLLVFVILFPGLYAFETKESSSYYFKLGATYPPKNSGLLPTVGLGIRVQKDYCGLDLSANLGTLVFVNYASLKSLCLFYPYPASRDQIYFGVGPGIGYQLNSIPKGIALHMASCRRGFLTVEGLIGYEFRHSDYYKTFMQIELFQPIISLNKHHRHYKPGIAFTAGIGF